MENAGAIWIDEPVVIDENIITSRNPNDLPSFCKAILETLE
jgi:protease I